VLAWSVVEEGKAAVAGFFKDEVGV